MIFLGVLTIMLLSYSHCQIFIEYGIGGEGRQLYNFFHDIRNGFYVDIGAYDPIFASNTLNLYVQGWGGVNIQANPERLNRFFLARPDQTNLNYAIGEQNTFLTLYQLDEDSSSTVSAKVKNFVADFKPLIKQIKVASMTMKQICQTYFYRKPIFMNLDIQGYGWKALQSNDWSNQNCVPEIIFSQINQQTVISGFPLPETILKTKGYRKLAPSVGLNQIFILERVYDKYVQKATIADKQFNKKVSTSINVVAYALGQYLKVRTVVTKHNQPTTDPIFYKFCKYGQYINLDTINKYSNSLNPQFPNRPIAIYHFNPKSSVIFVPNSNYKTNQIRAGIYRFLQINVTKNDNRTYSTYVFDHQFSSKTDIKIINMQAEAQTIQNKTYIPEQIKEVIQNKKTTTEMIVQSFNSQIQKQKNSLNDLNQIFMTNIQTANNKFESLTRRQIISLQQINKKLGSLQYKIKQIEQGYFEQQSSFNNFSSQAKFKQKKQVPIKKNISSQLASINTLQLFTMLTVLVMSILLCITICITKKSTKIKKTPRSASQSGIYTNQ